MRTPGTRCQSEPDIGNFSVFSACPSMFSESALSPRLDQLSKRTFSKKLLSSEQLEELAVQEKKREVNRMIHRNQTNCQRAIHGTDVASTGRVQSNMKLTAPSEFNLSTSRRPGRSPGPSCAASDVGSEIGSDLSMSVLSRQAKWTPQLTIPMGPALRVERRLSGERRRSRGLSEEPATEGLASGSQKIASRTATPERRREVLTRPNSARGVRPQAQKAAASSPVSVVGTSSSGLSRQERAEQARKLAQKKKDEEARAKKDKMFVFRRAQSSDEDQASMLSVDSTRSLRSTSSRQNGRPQSARGSRRPSFGSATPRPCNT